MRKMFFILLILFLGCTESNKYGTVTEDTYLYNDSKEDIQFIFKKNARVMAYGGKCEFSKHDEPLIRVMIRNKKGDFVDGNVVCIPERKIKWD